MLIETLVERYPRLYHMAEIGSWPNIQREGLLSTKAVLDRAQLKPETRFEIESEHRPNKILVPIPNSESISIRDQKPMSDAKLQNCLGENISPRQWYEYLNAKVFFWATEQRLSTLLSARAYAALEHDVLTINTASLIAAHAEEIWLCHMNSGNTSPWAHPRSFATFRRIAEYPIKRNGNPLKEVAEVVIDYAVSDIANHVVQVRRMRGNVVTSTDPY